MSGRFLSSQRFPPSSFSGRYETHWSLLFDAVVAYPIMSNAIGSVIAGSRYPNKLAEGITSTGTEISEGYATRDEEPEWSGP
jgi:hypothetical protein